MIRKAIIVVLTLAAVPFGIVGVLAGSGRTHWEQTLWRSGPQGVAGSSETNLYWGTSSLFMVHATMILDESQTPSRKRWSGLGLAYQTVVLQPDDTEFFVRMTVFVVSYLHVLAFAALFAAYPVVAFVRGPFRRRCRRRRGLCLRCGYDLTGNESGVCPECGTGVPGA